MRSNTSNKELITIEEASQLSGVEIETIFSRIRANKISWSMILGIERLFIRREDFNKMMNDNTQSSEVKGDECNV